MNTLSPQAVAGDLTSVAVRGIHLMVDGSVADLAEVTHPDGFTREREAAPPWARGTGPAGIHALAEWLRAAFTDMSYDIHATAAEGELITVHATMHGRQTGPLVFYTASGAVDNAFPPTGKTFAMSESHWFRMREGKIFEHWANRDDLGMARQLGWLPPSPWYLLRAMRLEAHAVREVRSAR
ncbi:ester cyclase [Nocardia asteroides]|uniref:ester cyclase n=1 Tax=Nocardia asteroides TaxID=1824 RepID=UPI001E5EE9AC|nr:ester cyclase [Nocardia asteroides]UGT56134.1 ester cyclase [Nocardia asteroides]